MSFSEYPDALIWECDTCGLQAQFPPTSFWAGLDEIKSRGWRITRDGEGWLHYCAKCKAKADEGILDRPSNKLRRVQ